MAHNQNVATDTVYDLDVKHLKSKLQQLQEEHKKLIAVASELTSALQLNVVGQTRNLQAVLNHCNAIYPSLFATQGIPLKNEFIFDNIHIDESFGKEHIQFSEFEEVKSKGQNNCQSAPHVESLRLDHVQLDNEDRLGLPVTPTTEREIRDILEIALTEAIRYLSDGNTETANNDCCKLGKACSSCQKEIFQIVESILTKVMESPRFKISDRGADNSSRVYSKVTHYQVQIPQESLNKIVDSLPLKTFRIQESSNTPTDYDVIKDSLLRESSEDRVKLLRALRRDLIRSSRKESSNILESYIQHDILNIKGQKFVPGELLRLDSALVDEQLYRLLNTIASFRRGRIYLAFNDNLLKSVLVPKFMKESTPAAKDSLVATLQKLSLQRRLRTQMIKEGILDYLVEFLSESLQKISLYGLEHSIALLMNLCLEDEAKYYCSSQKEKVVGLLKELLKDPHTCYVPYINGVLLSVLSDDKVDEEARKQGLDKVLCRLVQGMNDEYLQQQIRYIIKLWFSRQLKCFLGDDDNSPENEDVLESELDSDSEREPDVRKKNHKKELFNVNTVPADSFLAAGSQKQGSFKGGVRHVPRAPFCYMEACQDVHDGTKTCRCLRCTPGKNRYSCGCYDIICREIAEEIDNICRGQSIGRTKCVKRIGKKGRHDVNASAGEKCAICGDVICDCAFESRPKIHRTPPKS